jgi:hypothetical protein
MGKGTKMDNTEITLITKAIEHNLKFVAAIVLMATRHAYSPTRASEVAHELWDKCKNDVS